MNVGGVPTRPLRPGPSRDVLEVIDQRDLPHRLAWRTLADVATVFTAIRDMWVRGAPLIGAVAAYGVALQARVDASDAALHAAADRLRAARPTAVNLVWAVARMLARLHAVPVAARPRAAWDEAGAIAEDDVRTNAAIGAHGLPLLQAAAARRPGPVNVLTHCNAGWLATVDWGTATAPIYQAHAAGVPLHVWVDETRPRNQGAGLTAWELAQAGVPHTVIADNAGGHLMQHGRVDLVIVGCDRVTAQGDVCNKIGTYLKALAARDNGVPFYVAMPLSTLDLALADGLRDVEIEERSPREVTHVAGRGPDGAWTEVQVTPDGSPAANPAFDVTPARLVTGIVTERGIVDAGETALRAVAAAAAANTPMRRSSGHGFPAAAVARGVHGGSTGASSGPSSRPPLGPTSSPASNPATASGTAGSPPAEGDVGPGGQPLSDSRGAHGGIGGTVGLCARSGATTTTR